ncbi:hypothetical protein CAPTEDRAFT_205033 [Capitella teleta]|uniref:Uncharacterized protein n=1 Tax=Capitella teleta TaxID=283909 RepID=R7TGL8_CAPTE|nr:hypothetical protein CAPTEDRAFT_205033 [Capitella teleta]|eukprot:ELT90255.1 hypothetical protein CAPTEDRAFT_205033 [Capitella teleta]
MFRKPEQEELYSNKNHQGSHGLVTMTDVSTDFTATAEITTEITIPPEDTVSSVLEKTTFPVTTMDPTKVENEKMGSWVIAVICVVVVLLVVGLVVLVIVFVYRRRVSKRPRPGMPSPTECNPPHELRPTSDPRENQSQPALPVTQQTRVQPNPTPNGPPNYMNVPNAAMTVLPQKTK